MSGWDWLHAGLEVATYAKARSAQQSLNTMKTAQEIDAARQMLLNAMRDFIFDISRDIQLAEDNLNDSPQQVYILSRSLQWRLADSGLLPDMFPEFTDKDYVLKTQLKIKNVVSKAESKLDQKQLVQSEIGIRFLNEMPLLQRTVLAKSSLEQLRETEKEWNTLNGRNNLKPISKILGGVGLVASCCFGFTFGLNGLVLLGRGDIRNMFVGLFQIAIAVGIPAVSILLLYIGVKNNPKFDKLKAKRETWRSNLLSTDDWSMATELFGGDLPTSEYIKLLESRSGFLQPILGNEFQNFLTAGMT